MSQQNEPSATPADGSGSSGGSEETAIYNLPGTPRRPQVEPTASYWFRCPVPHAVSMKEVTDRLGSSVLPYPPNDSDQARQELKKLRDLAASREDEAAFDQSRLSTFLKDEAYVSPPPPGAVLNRRAQKEPILRYGAELARLFEAETPGLWHRHVLNVLLDPEQPLGMQLSPPRQALLWAALDVAISSALQAAWHYKWLATELDQVAFRPRPVEVDKGLDVLYDYRVDRDSDSEGNLRRGERRPEPSPSAGTPRHPAYPSGHSTYSAAASYVLGCLLPQYKEEFDKLANNIGEARLWGGVHWRTDHEAGQRIGRAVGELVIEQLNRSGIEVCPPPRPQPPSRESLKTEAVAFEQNCGQGQSNFCDGLDCGGQEASLQNALE